MRRGISVSENTDCEGTPGEGIMCRAGRGLKNPGLRTLRGPYSFKLVRQPEAC